MDKSSVNLGFFLVFMLFASVLQCEAAEEKHMRHFCSPGTDDCCSSGVDDCCYCIKHECYCTPEMEAKQKLNSLLHNSINNHPGR
ncbi:hypothetical protein VNO78_30902 [Psophocarpus tetragonolobus]|uniref:Uncharacterized protein n=1 Tax=Psophocarpus tetragonolobus TaxID=3891 RepID=A0AAN9X7J1_PSOTE